MKTATGGGSPVASITKPTSDRYLVAKDIRTPISHHRAGAIIGHEDLDGPLNAADWLRLGHLEPLAD